MSAPESAPTAGMAHPAELVADLAKGHIPARCLHVIADAGVADAVGPEGATPAAIAATTGLSADAVDRMLRLLAAHGIFEHGASDTYRHNAASELLRSDHPRSLRSYVRMTGMPSFWDRYTELHAAAREGQRPHTMASLVEYFASHPEESAIFNAAMVSKSRTVLPAVAAAYDFSPFATIADIGGGRGHLLELILERAPKARGVLFDLPHVVADAKPVPRLALAPGSFFTDEVPRADAYLLMDLLHDWDDGDAVRILSAVRRAAPSGARLLIVETLVAETPGPHFGKTLDIIMLAVTGGRERTRTQHGALLTAAGFDLMRVLPTASQYSIVEAVAV
jgi:hypothetical protein